MHSIIYPEIITYIHEIRIHQFKSSHKLVYIHYTKIVKTTTTTRCLTTSLQPTKEYTKKKKTLNLLGKHLRWRWRLISPGRSRGIRTTSCRPSSQRPLPDERICWVLRSRRRKQLSSILVHFHVLHKKTQY